MKVQILHISDIHISSTEDIRRINVGKIVRSLTKDEKADECIIVFSGDLAGKGVDYDLVRKLKCNLVN